MTAAARERGRESEPPVCIVGSCPLRIWNQTPGERLKRAFTRAGAEHFIPEGELDKHDGPLVLVRSDAALDMPLIQPLMTSPGIRLLDPGAEGTLAIHAPAGAAGAASAALAGRPSDAPAAAFESVTPDQLGSAYWEKLRKRETPYAMAVTPQNLRQVEWRVFMGTYKGATDFVTKWVWPWPAFHVTRFCARVGATPNMVTFVSLLLVIAAFVWFLQGNWLPGLIAAWVMTFLDTVDGKLARVTMTSSRFGGALDHGIDLVHPPFWYVAWGIGAWGPGLDGGGQGLSEDTLFLVLLVIVLGYLLQRAIEGLSLLLLKIEIHVWRPMDTLFRQVTARRNPNLALLSLGALAGRPDLGLVAVALWTALCLVLHGLQLLQALAARRREGRLVSWMERGAAP
jgi:phosphatidylglycerophosphate synthase